MSASSLLLAAALLNASVAPADTLGRVVTVERTRSTTVAATVLIPQGSAADPEGKAGASWLLAHALSSEANRRLTPLAAEVTPRILRGETTFTLLSPRDHWQEAFRRLSAVLFEAGPDPDALEYARAGLLDQLHFEEDAPVRRFQREVSNLLYGSADPWSRPIRGNPTSVSTVTDDDLEEIQRQGYRRDQAVVAVVGPDRDEVDAALASAPPPAPQPPPSRSSPEWRQGDRLRVTEAVTSTWIAVAYPLAPDLSPAHAEFLRTVLAEELVSVPPDPGLFGAEIRIEEGKETPILLVSAAVVPEMASRWEATVKQVVASLAAAPAGPTSFVLQRRRFRSVALLNAAHPELRSEDAARDLVRFGAVRELTAEIEALRASDLSKAAAGLGPARVLVFGPDLSEDDTGG